MLPRGGRTISAAEGYLTVLYAHSGQQLAGFNWLVTAKQRWEERAKAGQRRRAAFASVSAVSLSAAVGPALEFHPVSFEQLRAALARL